MCSAAGRGPRGPLLPGGGAGHAPSSAPPRLMRRLPAAARTGIWVPRHRCGLGEWGWGREAAGAGAGPVIGGRPPARAGDNQAGSASPVSWSGDAVARVVLLEEPSTRKVDSRRVLGASRRAQGAS